MYFSVSTAAGFLGVAVSTLRRWHREGRLEPDFVTPGGHRRYSMTKLKQIALDISNGDLNASELRVARPMDREERSSSFSSAHN